MSASTRQLTSTSRSVAQARSQIIDWFAAQGWKPFRFQRQAWNAYLNGKSGLIHATTGTGKTYAAWLGPVLQAIAEASRAKPSKADAPNRRQKKKPASAPIQVVWLTPLRALAADTLGALHAPLKELTLHWSVETRTSDTPSSVKSRQSKRLPTVLITTPESLSLLLSQPKAKEQFKSLRVVVADEWHELLGTKRGVQTELALARLRTWNASLQTWGLSATLGNTKHAMQVLLGNPRNTQPQGVLIEGARAKRYIVKSVIPRSIERFPWSGHLGLKQADNVVAKLERSKSSLVFTNTRSQTELWYRAILERRPDWAGQIALHHGSLDRDTRSWVEDALRKGSVKCVVCTSSLDLGVDFSPVDHVFQVGSPKGVARLLQRAGRSGHEPGRASRVTCVPTHAFELLECAAARDAIAAGNLEGREPIENPLDLLCQHLVTVAVGGGFEPEKLGEEIRSTSSFSSLTRHEWEWALDFVTTGGAALRAYPEFQKVQIDSGRYTLTDRKLAQRHRLAMGTIVSDSTLTVQYLRGPKLGAVEESFIAKVSPGEQFVIAGRQVELVRIHDNKVWVRKAKQKGVARIPRWMGGRMPLSTELASAVRNKLDEAARGVFIGPEMQSLEPLFQLQENRSRIPRFGELLIERTKSREGFHLFIYPFGGRLVHEGLAALLAYRLSQLQPITFSMSVNDYGLELLSPTKAPLKQALKNGLFSIEHLQRDIAVCMNAAELSKRQFREVAYIAGLVFPGYPGNRKSARQLQASTNLLYDVFTNYDPDNLLLQQAKREVLERQLEKTRLVETMQRMIDSQWVIRETDRFSPLGFPLMVDRLRERLSSEKLADRVRRMQKSLEKPAKS